MSTTSLDMRNPIDLAVEIRSSRLAANELANNAEFKQLLSDLKSTPPKTSVAIGK